MTSLTSGVTFSDEVMMSNKSQEGDDDSLVTRGVFQSSPNAALTHHYQLLRGEEEKMCMILKC